MFTKFEHIFAELASRGAKKRMIVAWGVDEHTIAAASKAIDLGLIEATLVGDTALINDVCEKTGIDVTKFTVEHNPVELKAIAQAVTMVREGYGDFLMKGLCSTDTFVQSSTRRPASFLRRPCSVTWQCSRILITTNSSSSAIWL